MKATTTVTYLDKELIASDSFHTLGVGTTTLGIAYGEEKIFIEFVVSEGVNQESNKMWGQIVNSDRLQVHILNRLHTIRIITRPTCVNRFPATAEIFRSVTRPRSRL